MLVQWLTLTASAVIYLRADAVIYLSTSAVIDLYYPHTHAQQG